MSGFGEREKDFENKYAYEEKIAFKVEARTAKLFGLWAAEKLGLNALETQDYVVEIINANLQKTGLSGITSKVSGDFRAKGIDMSDHVIHAHLDKTREEARAQVLTEIPPDKA